MGRWWLVTWVTYASWLPGDPRGFKTWRKRQYVPPPTGKSHFGEPTYRSEDYIEEHDQARAISGATVVLLSQERRLVLATMVEELEELSIWPSIVAVAEQHVHLIAKFGSLRIRPTVGRFKFATTQRLNRNGFRSQRPWAKGCHMESLPTEEAFLQAFEYIRKHQDDGAAVRIWQQGYADDILPS